MNARRHSVTVLAGHRASGQSMRRYGDLLVDAYRAAGWSVQLRHPSQLLSSRFLHAPRVYKQLVYVEKLVLFPLSLALRRPRTAIVHVSDHSDAPWLRRIGSSTPALITCHDLIAIKAAAGDLDEHTPRRSGRLYQRYIGASLQRARMILAVSSVTLDDVRVAFPESPSRLLRNPLSPGVTDVVDPSRPDLADPYLLVVGSSSWRKRREVAVDVWQRLRRTVDPSIRLVIVGEPLTPAELALLPSAAGALDGLELRSDVSDAELAGYYAHAEGVLQPSSHEGFGWPVVEANHWGTVVVCSQLPVFHEVGPENVFIDDDLDAVDWREVWSGLHDPGRRAAVRRDAQRFSPTTFSRELDELARTAADQRPDGLVR